jgi:predicted metal-binding membrane protein
MTLSEWLAEREVDPLATLLWGVSCAAFAISVYRHEIHATPQILCGPGSWRVLGDGVAYLALLSGTVGFRAFGADMILMIIAMMTPALAGPFLHLWFRSLSRHRLRSIALFLLGYLSVWLAASVLLFAIALSLVSFTAEVFLAATVAAILALIWHASALRSHCLARCHLRPRLSIFGLGALANPLRFGATHAAWCVTTCWALMLACFCTRDAAHLATMMLGAVVIALERTAQGTFVGWTACIEQFWRRASAD